MASLKSGFTLIELSIVLVIIGLIVGGILVGQDLIKAAEVRSQISQIEKYNSAVNTFRGKFGGIPGDLALSMASQYGFATGFNCSGGVGNRDGNGLLDGDVSPNLLRQNGNETALFWRDLASDNAGNLIEGIPPGMVATGCNFYLSSLATSQVPNYFVPAKIGHGNYLYVYETSGYNWYGVAQVLGISLGTPGLSTSATIPVIQAYNIDKKIDDGLPTTGSVQAVYIYGSLTATSPAPSAPTDSTTTCFNTTGNAYSLSSLASYGANGNCALSFRFQ